MSPTRTTSLAFPPAGQWFFAHQPMVPPTGPFPGLSALCLSWPADQRYAGAALHAKIIVVDDEVALVGSANVTSRAMETNLECGILLHGGPHPRAIRAHIIDLYA